MGLINFSEYNAGENMMEGQNYAELKNAAVESFNDVGAWSFKTWDTLNRRYFKGKNIPGPIVWESSRPDDIWIGRYGWSENIIILNTKILNPVWVNGWGDISLEGNKRYVSDVMLHEMIHQRAHQIDCGAAHCDKTFLSEVARLSERLGLNKKGHFEWRDIAHFPHTLRPPNYYGGTSYYYWQYTETKR